MRVTDFVTVLGALPMLASAVTAPNNTCCSALSDRFPNNTFFPHDDTFAQSLASYFSQQEATLKPNCILRPDNVEVVAAAVKTLTNFSRFDCPFAVRGGGHTPWAGSANIQDGVTIDLSLMNHVDVSVDGSVVYAEGGATWGDIYAITDELNLTIVGGRASQVGVAGLTLGGGISYLSPRYGFVCDNVNYFQIVLASGEIVDAWAENNQDLYLALKGGSSNFGIVTSFAFAAVSMGEIWGGQIVYNISHVPQALGAFSEFNAADPYDEYASTIQSVAYAEGTGLVGVNDFEYTQPIANPPAFAGYDSIQPRLSSTLRITSLKDITDEQGSFSPDGLRQLYITLTFKNDLPFLQSVYSVWNETVNSTITCISGINYAMVLQPIPPAITSKSANNGGNSLGLSPSDGPLVLLQLSIMWQRSSDDATLTSIARALINQIDAAAKEKGLHSDFIYLNYALDGQDPIAGYGIENVGRLRGVSFKYDPDRVFQRQVPGGFKLLV